MQNDAQPPIQSSMANQHLEQPSHVNKKYQTATIILSALLIISIVVCGVVCWQMFSKSDEISSLASQIKEKDQEIALLKNVTSPIDDETSGDEQIAVPDSEPAGLYWSLDKIGMRIPITQELADNITLVEIGGGYRLDFNLITKYREEGYCANGGSSALGNITKATVSRDFVENDPILYSFTNNVAYPKTYITYNWYGDSTMCQDFGEGGEARHDEVEQAVQKLQEPLAQAIEKIEPIK